MCNKRQCIQPHFETAGDPVASLGNVSVLATKSSTSQLWRKVGDSTRSCATFSVSYEYSVVRSGDYVR